MLYNYIIVYNHEAGKHLHANKPDKELHATLPTTEQYPHLISDVAYLGSNFWIIRKHYQLKI